MNNVNETYSVVRKYINLIIDENSCVGNDDLMDYTNILEDSLEDFSLTLENLEIEINRMGETSEV